MNVIYFPGQKEPRKLDTFFPHIQIKIEKYGNGIFFKKEKKNNDDIAMKLNLFCKLIVAKSLERSCECGHI